MFESEGFNKSWVAYLPSTASKTAVRQTGVTELLGVPGFRSAFTETPEMTAPCSLMYRSADVNAPGFCSTSVRGINRPPSWNSVMLLGGVIAT